MIRLPELEKYTPIYAELDMKPLVITAHLRPGGRVVSYDPPVYLDGLLARCVVDLATHGMGVPDAPYDGYWIPLPLRLAWKSSTGFPLWDSSVFYPSGPHVDDVFYQHKRMNPGDASNTRKVRTVVGRWMDRRTPLPVSVCDTWVAHCVGNQQSIQDLLQNITHLGKRRAIGFGEIERWEIQPGDFETALVDNGITKHAIPAGYLECKPLPMRVGWTPPQWKQSLMTLGWPVGTSIDGQAF